MKCEICKTITRIGQAFMLPVLVIHNGQYQNLVACCKECRIHWFATHPTYCARNDTKGTRHVTR